MQHRYACILGRTPELSVEELLVVLRPMGHIVEVTRQFLIFEADINPATLLSRLGGTTKIVALAGSYAKWDEFTQDAWLHQLRSELREASGKFNFGASVYGDTAIIRSVYADGIVLKKKLRALGISSRFVSNREGVLSSVVVKKNNLLNRELVVLKGSRWYVGLTAAVQDFDSYGLRDYGRPARNMERGMLPPKLAQIMLNLAEVRATDRILDPFCGGGTILQEALLCGLDQVWGSDKDHEAIAEAGRNFDWLQAQFGTHRPNISVHPVEDLPRIHEKHFFDAVVTEPFLGPARLLKRRSLTRETFADIQRETNALYASLFRSIREILKPGGRAVVIFPTFHLFGRAYSAGDFDAYGRLGWKLQQPKVAELLQNAQLSERGMLLFSRKDQIVSRELTVWLAQ